MTPKERDEFILESLAFWRDKLKISKELKIRLKYVTHREDDEDRKYATITRDMLPYNRAILEIYDEVFASRDFQKDAEEAICHEVLHLAMAPLISYCSNMFNDDPGKQKHLEDLEEAVVTTLEGSLTELSKRIKTKR